MICQECQKKEAHIFFKQIINNQLTQYVLCSDCARKKGISASPSNLFLQLAFGPGGFLPPVAQKRPGIARCRSCGSRLSDLEEYGGLGCPDCYESFQQPLAGLLARIHGADRHTGKKPPQPAAPGKEARPFPAEPDLEALRQKLKAAIAREDFEAAAKLRDEIRRLGKP